MIETVNKARRNVALILLRIAPVIPTYQIAPPCGMLDELTQVRLIIIDDGKCFLERDDRTGRDSLRWVSSFG